MFFERTKQRRNQGNNRLLVGLTAAFIFSAAHAGVSQASSGKYTVLHVFCASGTCTDGAHPQAPLIADVAGNLYGAAPNGGNHNGGLAFELSPDSKGKKWKDHPLYEFCAKGGSGCSDGQAPNAALLSDQAGDLFGTTAAGGTVVNSGTVFELVTGPSGKKRAENVLHRFCPPSGCTDGESPSGPMIMDASGNLYGTTFSGGANHAGEVFELTFDAKTKRWKETLPYSFCPAIGCADGSNPTGGVIMDKSGNLFGVATSGGNACNPGCGVVYELTLNASTHKWSERVIHNFATTEGSGPQGTLVMDDAGNLFGVAEGGGTNCQDPDGPSCGTVYELSFNTATKSWGLGVIHNFCTKSGCADGLSPASGLIMDSAGNLYGATSAGGASTCNIYGTGCGVVFELVPDAKAKTWRETVLHTFCQSSGCADGYDPMAALLLPCPNDNGVYQCQGTLYGTTEYGGASSYCYQQGCGVAYALKP